MAECLPADVRKGRFETTAPVPPLVEESYRQIHRMTGAVGGNGSFGPIYGEMTKGSMQKVCNFLCRRCQFDKDSVFLDVGAGLGKPSMHMAIATNCRASLGIEVERIRFKLSVANLRELYRETHGALSKTGRETPNLFLACADVMDLPLFNPVTHLFVFDVGMPPAVMCHIAHTFNQSESTQYLVLFRSPRRAIQEWGFAVELIDHFSVHLTGSREGHQCYVFRKTLGAGRQSTLVPPLFRTGLELLASGWDAVRHNWELEFLHWDTESVSGSGDGVSAAMRAVLAEGRRSSPRMKRARPADEPASDQEGDVGDSDSTAMVPGSPRRPPRGDDRGNWNDHPPGSSPHLRKSPRRRCPKKPFVGDEEPMAAKIRVVKRLCVSEE